VIYENLVGRKFGKYTVVKQAKSKNWTRRWVCKCTCGKKRTISTEHLTSGKRTGCNTCNNGNLKRPFEGRYNFLCDMARRRSYGISLTYEEYLTFTKMKVCKYCGTHIQWDAHGTFSNGHHLDRKDNTLGYSKKNCVVCCGPCNQIKSNRFTYEQMLQIGEVIKSWRT
jgi:hypothetical protein